MEQLLLNIASCIVCKAHLPNLPRPILQANAKSRILIIGQAPGQKVQDSGIPWDDLSGNELRRWLGVNKQQFYNPNIFALMPMGFCYPGKGTTGDKPPRKECAPLWHPQLLDFMRGIKLTLLIGQYSQDYYLKSTAKATLTETVRHYREYLPAYFPLAHPSPRNHIWQKKNPWFQAELIPELQLAVSSILQ